MCHKSFLRSEQNGLAQLSTMQHTTAGVRSRTNAYNGYMLSTERQNKSPTSSDVNGSARQVGPRCQGTPHVHYGMPTHARVSEERLEENDTEHEFVSNGGYSCCMWIQHEIGRQPDRPGIETDRGKCAPERIAHVPRNNLKGRTAPSSRTVHNRAQLWTLQRGRGSCRETMRPYLS